MVEQAAQAVHDGEAEPEAAPLFATGFAESVELAENELVLILRDAGSAVPDLDAQPIAPLAATDNDTARAAVADRVRHQIEYDPLQKDEIAAQPSAAAHHAQQQAL